MDLGALSASADRGRGEDGQHPSPTAFLSWLLWVHPLSQSERVIPQQALGCCKLKMRVEPGDIGQGKREGSDTNGRMLASTVMPIHTASNTSLRAWPPEV